MSADLTVRLDTVQLKSDDRTLVVQQSGQDVRIAGVSGPAGSLSYCGAFSSSQTQTAAAGSAVAMTFNTTEISVGVEIQNSSRMVIANPGIWNVQFSAQLLKNSGGHEDVSIWLAQNGSPVANSTGDVQIAGNNTAVIAAWNYVIQTTTINEFLQLMWSSPAGDIALTAVASRTAPIRPAIPSVIATVTPVLVNPW